MKENIAKYINKVFCGSRAEIVLFGNDFFLTMPYVFEGKEQDYGVAFDLEGDNIIIELFHGEELPMEVLKIKDLGNEELPEGLLSGGRTVMYGYFRDEKGKLKLSRVNHDCRVAEITVGKKGKVEEVERMTDATALITSLNNFNYFQRTGDPSYFQESIITELDYCIVNAACPNFIDLSTKVEQKKLASLDETINAVKEGIKTVKHRKEVLESFEKYPDYLSNVVMGYVKDEDERNFLLENIRKGVYCEKAGKKIKELLETTIEKDEMFFTHNLFVLSKNSSACSIPDKKQELAELLDEIKKTGVLSLENKLFIENICAYGSDELLKKAREHTIERINKGDESGFRNIVDIDIAESKRFSASCAIDETKKFTGKIIDSYIEIMPKIKTKGIKTEELSRLFLNLRTADDIFDLRTKIQESAKSFVETRQFEKALSCFEIIDASHSINGMDVFDNEETIIELIRKSTDNEEKIRRIEFLVDFINNSYGEYRDDFLPWDHEMHMETAEMVTDELKKITGKEPGEKEVDRKIKFYSRLPEIKNNKKISEILDYLDEWLYVCYEGMENTAREQNAEWDPW